LQRAWNDVRDHLRLASRTEVAQGQGHGSSISLALERCEQERDYLETRADLFEPQRGQYIKIIGKWREQIWQRAEDAVGLLDVLDKFNRHTYRASSDRLMSSITELALQTAPISLSLPGKVPQVPLRKEIERRLGSHPLVQTIFESGNRLVGSTLLAGTLFAVARNYFREPSAPVPRQTTLSEIEAELRTLCRFEELALQPLTAFSAEIPAPGTLAVWDTILQEVATNTKKYCGDTDATLLVSCEMVQKRVRLSFAGRRPFIDCLTEERRRQVEEKASTTDRLKTLRELVKLAEEPGQRLAPQIEGVESSGMGLTLILRICRYLRMLARVDLQDLEKASRRRPGAVSADMQLRWPLGLVIEWEEEL
jgi:hypothetical protein